MKNLVIMDYEKKYNKALNLAKSYYGKGTNEFLDTIFPELADSEDEKIRKEIIAFLIEDDENGYLLHSDRERWVAYLEKQKEQKPAEWSEEDEELKEQTISLLETYDGDEEHCNIVKECVSWLKSLRPQPHWNPNAPQMRALKEAVNEWKGYSGYPTIESLYNDLKKL